MRKTLLAAAFVAAASVSIPTFASAQTWRIQEAEEACRRERTQNRNTGAVIGGAAGAAIGSEVAGQGRRTTGALVGGVLGAVAGAYAGRSQADCADRHDAYARAQGDRYGAYGEPVRYASEERHPGRGRGHHRGRGRGHSRHGH